MPTLDVALIINAYDKGVVSDDICKLLLHVNSSFSLRINVFNDGTALQVWELPISHTVPAADIMLAQRRIVELKL